MWICGDGIRLFQVCVQLGAPTFSTIKWVGKIRMTSSRLSAQSVRSLGRTELFHGYIQIQLAWWSSTASTGAFLSINSSGESTVSKDNIKNCPHLCVHAPVCAVDDAGAQTALVLLAANACRLPS